MFYLHDHLILVCVNRKMEDSMTSCLTTTTTTTTTVCTTPRNLKFTPTLNLHEELGSTGMIKVTQPENCCNGKNESLGSR